jgi:hypothetical protein
MTAEVLTGAPAGWWMVGLGSIALSTAMGSPWRSNLPVSPDGRERYTMPEGIVSPLLAAERCEKR